MLHFLSRKEVNIMKDNLVGELKIMKDLNIIPNCSALQRKYGTDRHTIKKYYANDGIPLRKKVERTSRWDPLYDEIVCLMEIDSVSKKAVYNYLENKYKDNIPGTYNGFKAYTLRKGIQTRSSEKPHVLYEVEPGYQLQCDWKENMKIHLKNGEEIIFNVFSATLGYSREHVLIYSSSKTTQDFIRCIIETFRRLGGTTQTILTDNMSAVVTVKGRQKKIHPQINQLMKDLNTDLKLCKAKTPQTKGKDENSNKFVKWIYPYDYSLESEEELIHTIENVICSQCNRQINSSTRMPPSKLFQKEKDYLQPLPNKILLESYLAEHTVSTVPPTLLIQYKGCRYSVPQQYINKRVDIYQIENRLYIYHNKNLVTIHTLTQQSVNYKEEHYKKALETTIRNKDVDIEKASVENLKRLESLGK